MPLLLVALLLIGLLIIASKFSRKRKNIKKLTCIAVLGRPWRGKLLRDLAAKARSEYPGQSEQWYWRKAQSDLKRYRD